MLRVCIAKESKKTKITILRLILAKFSKSQYRCFGCGKVVSKSKYLDYLRHGDVGECDHAYAKKY